MKTKWSKSAHSNSQTFLPILEFTHTHTHAHARRNERTDMAKVIVEFMLFFAVNVPKMAFQSPSGMHAMGKRWDVCSCSMRSPAACREQDEQVTSWLTFPDFNTANIPPGGAAAAADRVIAKTTRHGVSTISLASLLCTTNNNCRHSLCI
jgi:hypothetical protein